eukprot:c21937_g1_i3.p1 GENE.c21937_g1_i3~~c21937_g1_i3.p1  ORF type:complete len:581 (+),score=261.62 c21937_g1_i3:496-2238(+)
MSAVPSSPKKKAMSISIPTSETPTPQSPKRTPSSMSSSQSEPPSSPRKQGSSTLLPTPPGSPRKSNNNNNLAEPPTTPRRKMHRELISKILSSPRRSKSEDSLNVMSPPPPAPLSSQSSLQSGSLLDKPVFIPDINLIEFTSQEAVDLYSVYCGEQSLKEGNLLKREKLAAEMGKRGVFDSNANVIAKILDFHLTREISFDAFEQGYRIGAVAKVEEDAERVNGIMHALVHPIIEIGPQKDENKKPVIFRNSLVQYLQLKYSVEESVAHTLVSQVDKSGTGFISSVKYIQGVLNGIFPVNADQVPQLVVFAKNFQKLAGPHYTKLSRERVKSFLESVGFEDESEMKLVIDILCENSGEIAFYEYCQGVKGGILPIPREGSEIIDEKEKASVKKKVKQIKSSFKKYCDKNTENDIYISYERYKQILLLQNFTEMQSDALVLITDKKKDKKIDLIEFGSVVVKGIVSHNPKIDFRSENGKSVPIVPFNRKEGLYQGWIEEPTGFFGTWTRQYLIIVPGQLFTFDEEAPTGNHWKPNTSILFTEPPELALLGLELAVRCGQKSTCMRCQNTDQALTIKALLSS